MPLPECPAKVLPVHEEAMQPMSDETMKRVLIAGATGYLAASTVWTTPLFQPGRRNGVERTVCFSSTLDRWTL